MTSQNVTTIIANHNYGKWVEGCIDSAAASTHPFHQIAFVDDGSDDNSVNIIYSNMVGINQFKLDDIEGIDGKWKNTGIPILLVSCSPARGPSAARNIAIKASWDWSNYFQILDADDEMKPEKISKLLELFDSADVGFAYADYDNVDENGVAVRQFKESFSRQRLLHECIVHSGSLVSKKRLEKVGLYDESLRCAEDYDFWLRLSEFSRGASLPESLTTVRVGSHNSTSTVKSEVWQACWRKVAEGVRIRGAGLRRIA